MVEIDFAGIERKWQDRWAAEKVFETGEDSSKEKFYVLEMFPYPSGAGLHIGHALNYTIGDILARFKIMQGFNVLHPMGYDSLGLPAENAAIKAGTHPEDYTNASIENFVRQTKALGATYDWSRVVNTASPDYYKWDQWIFLKMLEKGLAYQKEASVNWCPKCNTVLANEQVESGKCWRHEDTEVEVRKLRQWFFRTTEYAEELLKGHDEISWPERTVAMQKNWIGRSEGTEICFEVEGKNKEKVILVDGINCLVDKKDGVFHEMHELLEKFPNRKIFLTGANDEEFKKYNLKDVPYEIFTLKHNPDKKDTKYYEILFDKFGLSAKDVIYFEHNKDAVKSAESVGIKTFYYDKDKKDLTSLGNFIEENLEPRTNTDEHGRNTWKVFTTRPDTIFGVTFMVVAAGHDRLDELVTEEQRGDVNEYLKRLSSVSEKDIERNVKEGVFSGSYAVNPATGERVPIWVGNFVLADYGSGMVMGVPAHDVRDFDFATKYGIEVRQVVAPYFLEKEGPDAVREDKETVERDAVFCIVKHWENEEYYCLDWKKFGWKSLVIGGVDEGESPKDAAIRETKEETGYQNIKNVTRINAETHSNFFAEHKDVNRYGKFKAFLVELGSDEWVEPEEKHVKNHNGKWIKEEDVESYLNLENNGYIWSEFFNGESSYVGEGVLINSGEFDKMGNVEAKEKITDWLAEKGGASKVVNYKLRDWGVSRQRYWGTPIPVVHCESCGAVPVDEKDLPVELPKDVKFGEGNPLETNEDWINTSCPKCGEKSRRETDTMDTFVNSSWYFLRYTDPNNSEEIFDKGKVKYWNPVDVYIGGAEHACMHLLYARFYTKVLRDIGVLDFDEPFSKLFHQGMIHAEGGKKMSKSVGNIIDPLDAVGKYGADALRWFLISVASPDKNFDWSEKGISGATRFVKRVVSFYDSFEDKGDNDELVVKLNLVVRNVSGYYENFDYRKATIELRELFELMGRGCSRETALKFLKLICPICPHVSEEFWSRLGNSDLVSLSEWPSFDEDKVSGKKEGGDLNGKIVERVKGILKDDTDKVYVYVMPFELESVDASKISDEVGKEVRVFAVNDSEKVDPGNRAKKAKPGMASVYLE